MTRDRVIRPRRMWGGLIVALAGACLLALWTATWQPTPGIAGAVLLVLGGLTAAFAGVLYDTHGGSRPLTGEMEELREPHRHQGTKPGDMITDPRLRAHAAAASRRSEAVRQAAQTTARPALQPLGAWLLLICAVGLIIAQGHYPHTHTGQDNATRSLLLAVVVVLAALRMLLAQRPRRVLSGLPAIAGVLLIAFAVFSDHDRHASEYFELVAGSWILIAALLSLDLPRDDQGPAAVPDPPSVATAQPLIPDSARALPAPGQAGLTGLSLTGLSGHSGTRGADRAARRTPARVPGRTASRLRTVVALALLIVSGARALHRRRSLRHGRASWEQPDSLRYRMPPGQDPAAVVATLRQAHYDVAREEAPTRIQELVITRPTGAGLERSAVRAVIARAPTDLEGAPAPAHPVVFADEPRPAWPTV